MGLRDLCRGWVVPLCLAGLALAGGCQSGPGLATRELAEHQAAVEKEGLLSVQRIEALKITCAAPEMWVPLPLYKGALYTHQQWRSPTRATGVGIIYAHLPLPLPVSTLMWFAKQEYTKSQAEGKLLAQWTDSFGRSWFEAENNKYHVKGYAVVQGTDAWFVYSGYRMTLPQREEEIALAERCQETILIEPKPVGDAQVSARE